MKIPARVVATFDGTLNLLAGLGCVLILFAMLSITADVTTRYVLGGSVMMWVIEICGFIIFFITFLGAAWLLKREGHVKMDLVVNRLKPRGQALLNTITSIVCAIVCLALTWLSLQTTYRNFRTGLFLYASLEPKAYIFHAAVAVGMLLLFIQFLRRGFGYLRSYKATK